MGGNETSFTGLELREGRLGILRLGLSLLDFEVRHIELSLHRRLGHHSIAGLQLRPAALQRLLEGSIGALYLGIPLK